jgi:aryl-alcohol dehydrogenase-like predicted oxidoreductase
LAEYATPEGTGKFAADAIATSRISPDHFRNFEGLTLSSLGMGTYLGPIDEATDKMLQHAVARSIMSGAINVIDTAINYRFQKSERCVGRALKSLFSQKVLNRDQVFVCTKNGYLAPDADYEKGYSDYLVEEMLKPGVITESDIVGRSHCMTVPYLEHELERSRRNLGLQTIDLLYLHNAAESQIPIVGRQEFLKRLEEAFRFFEKSRHEGKIEFYGMATWTSFRNQQSDEDHLELKQVCDIAAKVAGASNGFKFVQFPYNLAMPEAMLSKNQSLYAGEDPVSLLEACDKLKIGAFTSVPLLQGRLLAQISLPKIGKLSNSQVNLQFARSTPGILSPLVGHKNPRHVEENVAIALSKPLTPQEFSESFAKS